MDESKAAWDQVGERFTELGQRLKQQYDARAAFGEDERARWTTPCRSSRTRSTRRSRRSATRCGRRREGTAQGDRDLVANAVTTTFHELSEELKGRFGKKDEYRAERYGMTSMPSSASSCWRGLAPTRALEAAVAEQADHRDALHAVLLRERRLVVDVDLHDLVGAGASRRSSRRSARPAGTARTTAPRSRR